MQATAIAALSPLDGRYAAKVDALRPWLSEYGLMRCRVRVEVEWFLALADAGLAELKPPGAAERAFLRELVDAFSPADAEAIKAIERRTNHDVKAVEYWLGERFASQPGLVRAVGFLHFACTSEDINNASHALMLDAARREALLPALDGIARTLAAMARAHADVAMLARTHGQTASPTTLGKEIANVAVRLHAARAAVAAVPMRAKMNGAVGNYNAHVAAYPELDWQRIGRDVVERRLGLEFNPWTTQIEPHDAIAALFDAVKRCNTILIDWSRDVWGYVSLGYFVQSAVAGEVGSSTMPHKVNPIDFENAEGNLGLANALLAYDSLARGLAKHGVGRAAIDADLDGAWEVLAEPVQTVLRRHGVAGAYEQLKDLTRGKAIDGVALHAFIRGAPIPADARDRLLALTPRSYVGKAAELARAAADAIDRGLGKGVAR